MKYIDANLFRLESIEKVEELKKVRALFFSAVISYPLWGLLSNYMVPLADDPLSERLLLSALTGILLILTYIWKNIYKYLSKLFVVGWLFSYHLLYIYWKNPDSNFHFISMLIQFTIIVLIFPTKRSAQIYTYTKFLAVIIFSFFTYKKGINTWFFVLSIITIGHYLLTVLIEHFNVLDDLKKSRKKFDLALSTMHEGVLVINGQGIITFSNNSALEMLGLSSDSAINKSFRETCLYLKAQKEDLSFFSEDDNPFVLAINKRQAIKSAVLGISLNNGRHWLQFNIQPLNEDSENSSVLVSFSDVSTLKKNQEFKDMQQAQLAMKAKLNSLFTIAGGIAHEINNPLGIIVARLQSMEKLLDGDRLDKEALKTTIATTNRAAYRIAKIVTTLLNFSRNPDEQPMVVVTLSDVIAEAMSMTQERFKNHNVEIRIDNIPEAKIKCRPQQLAQVFLNILTNSFQAIVKQQQKWVSLTFNELDHKVIISICDSGPSVPDEIKSRMFDPFFSTKEVGIGAGLGLSVSKAIVEEHKGVIYVDKNVSNVCLILELPTYI